MGFFINWFKHYSLQKKRKAYLESLNKIAVSPNKQLQSSEFVSFSHIGLIGDIIYSIPAMLALAKEKKIHLYLDINQDALYSKEMKHYNSDKILTSKSVKFIAPLILNNPQFEVCKAWENEHIDYNLNEFRKYPFDYRMGHICRWYFLAFGVNYNLNNPWLLVKTNLNYKNDIIIARSFRYRALGINYHFLSRYDNVKFVGLKEEFNDMKKVIPNIEHLEVKNALQLAQIISGCKFFIGNQSFPFALASLFRPAAGCSCLPAGHFESYRVGSLPDISRSLS